jgi:AraC-like DNA-binding protein
MSAPLVDVVHTADTDEAAEAIHQSFGSRMALSSDAMEYGHDLVVGDVVAVSDISVTATLHAVVERFPDPMLVQLSAGHYSYDPWGSMRDFTGGGQFVVPPDRSIRFDVGDIRMRTLSFSAAAFRDIARDLFDVPDASISVGAVEPVSPAWAQYWPGAVRFYRECVLGDAMVYDNDLLREQATRTLVLGAISTFGLIEARGLRANESASVRRACAYIDDHLKDPVTIQDIAQAARITPRGLHFAFRRERDQTPMRYLRDGRLAGARRDLLEADPTDGATVGRIAAAWGFTNRGRFAVEYERRYGEPPRTTLHQ